MRTYSLWVILFSIFIFISCDGGGGGGGSSDLGPPPVLYDGLTTPASVTSENYTSFFSLLINSTIISVPDVDTASASSAGLARAYTAASESAQMASAAASRFPVSGTEDGAVSGTMSFTGNIEEDSTGTITFTFLNFNDGDGYTYDGKIIVTVYVYDGIYGITEARFTFWLLTITTSLEDYTLSGTLDMNFDIATITETDTLNLDGINNLDNNSFRYTDTTMTATCDSYYAPSYCTQDMTGRFYFEPAGYVQVSTVTPLEFNFIGQFSVDIFDAGGPLIMTGDLETGIRITPVDMTQVGVDVDTDSDPDYEFSELYRWSDLLGIEYTWEGLFGSAANFEVGYSAIETADGGFVSTGWSNTGFTNGLDFMILRTNAAGQEKWTKFLGGTDDEYGMAIRQTDDGGYVVAGYVEASSNYGVVYKVDPDGNEVWNRPLSSVPASQAYDIITTSDGGYLAAGYRDSNTTAGFGWQDLYLAKLNANGTIAWENVYGGTYMDKGYSVIEVSTGGYLVVGMKETWDNTFDQDIWLVRTDIDGNLQWESSFGGQYTQYGFDVVEDTDGNFAVSGTSYTIDSGYVYTFHKVDPSGNVLTSSTFDTTTNNLFRSSITNSDDGGYVVVANESFDIEMFKLDSTGGVAWQKTFNWSNSLTMCTAASVEGTADGGYIIGGSAWPSADKDFYLIKTDSNGNL